MLFVGIDIAKDKHDCCILSSTGEELAYFTFSNDRVGFERLISTISSFGSLEDAKIGLESTGHYSTNIANFL
ncbi:MAG TPA: transposase, partial [Syntrophomonadaceae bacterium]|nr:transposase [Syntrophomonadaceae bacterium]